RRFTEVRRCEGVHERPERVLDDRVLPAKAGAGCGERRPPALGRADDRSGEERGRGPEPRRARRAERDEGRAEVVLDRREPGGAVPEPEERGGGARDSRGEKRIDDEPPTHSQAANRSRCDGHGSGEPPPGTSAWRPLPSGLTSSMPFAPTKAIQRPSGDHAGAAAPCAIRRRARPSAPTV